jgi:hypothetical protein
VAATGIAVLRALSQVGANRQRLAPGINTVVKHANKPRWRIEGSTRHPRRQWLCAPCHLLAGVRARCAPAMGASIIRSDDRQAAEAELGRVNDYAANARLREVD